MEVPKRVHSIIIEKDPKRRSQREYSTLMKKDPNRDFIFFDRELFPKVDNSKESGPGAGLSSRGP